MTHGAKQKTRRLCRPPRGGRGLKLLRLVSSEMVFMSPSTQRAWIEMVKLIGETDQY